MTFNHQKGNYSFGRSVSPFLKGLYKYYRQLRQGMMQRWHRDLPFDELLFDRWERAKWLGFGEGSSIYHNSYVYGDVSVGSHTWIGPYTLLDGTGGLTIGDYCSVSAGVCIYTHDTVKWALSGGVARYEYNTVSIGNCCYLGSGSIINKGLTIGEYSLIGAMTFVNRNIPDHSIVVGIPCRVIGKVIIDDDNVELSYD